MRIATAVSLAAALLACGCGPRSPAAPAAVKPAPTTPPAAATARAAGTEVERITGAVTAASAATFADRIAAREGQIVGVKVTVEPGADADFNASRYLVSAEEDPFSISIGDGNAEGDGYEVVLPKAEVGYLHGQYVIDGFYQVKAGGMHQGTISYGLEKVDPASVLLNGAVTVKDRALP